MRPENVESTFGIRPTRIHHLGYTSLTRSEFERYLLKIMSMFRREVYDLVNWNCNHFSDHATRYLVGRSIPTYILDLPHEICKTFMGKIVLNFIRMMHGGHAPVAIDDPQHPSRVLKSSISPPEDDALKPSKAKCRRYSCPASPSNKAAAAAASAAMTGLKSYTDEAPRSYCDPLTHRQGKNKLRVPRTDTLSTVASPSSAIDTPPTYDRRRRQSACAYIEANDLGKHRTQKSPAGSDLVATNIDSTFLQPPPLLRIKCAEISGGDGSERVETEVVFSPQHRRLYELEKSKYSREGLTAEEIARRSSVCCAGFVMPDAENRRRRRASIGSCVVPAD